MKSRLHDNMYALNQKIILSDKFDDYKQFLNETSKKDHERDYQTKVLALVNSLHNPNIIPILADHQIKSHGEY